jgi:large subunit ribosomal protein L14e
MEVLKMFEIGRLCMKIAGRDAGKKCLIVDVIDEHFVMIDGETRRRKCNIKHLEPLNQVAEVTKNAPAPEVVRILKKMGIEIEEKKPKTKTVKARTERPKHTRKRKEKPVKETKAKPKPARETQKTASEKPAGPENTRFLKKESKKEIKPEEKTELKTE